MRAHNVGPLSVIQGCTSVKLFNLSTHLCRYCSVKPEIEFHDQLDPDAEREAGML